MKYVHTFEDFLNETVTKESDIFNKIKDKYLENPYGIGAESIEYFEEKNGHSARLIFRHSERGGRDKVMSSLKSMGVPTKKLYKSTQEKGFRYPYELTMYEK